MSEDVIRVVILDDHEGVRLGHEAALSRKPGIRVVANLDNPAQLEEVIASKHATLLLMDVRMDNFNAPKTVARLKNKFPHLRILAVSAYVRREYVVSLSRAGIDGYCLKTDPLEMMVKAVQQVSQGIKWFSPEAGGKLTPDQMLDELSEREITVLEMIAADATTDQIADELCVSKRTVETNIRHILLKLHVESRGAAIAKAIHEGFISDTVAAKSNAFD